MAWRDMARRAREGSVALLALAGLLLPLFPVRAGTITWPQATSLVLSGSGITLTIDAASQADSLTVNPSSFVVTVANGETFTVRYPGPSYGTMTNNGSINDCNIVGSDNVSAVSGPATVTFTPSATTCTPASSGGGGGYSGPTSVRLYAPNGGERIAGGSVYKVFWTYAGAQGRNAEILLSLNGGAFVSLAAGLNHMQGYYDVTLPTPAADATARMRLNLLDYGTVIASDDSDAAFTIDVPDATPAPAETPTPEPGEAGPLPDAYDPAATIASDKALLDAAPSAATALCATRDLIKLPDDGNPATQHDSAVYYCGRDGKRYAFPNAHVYATWYADFSNISIVTSEELAALPLGGNVTYRPGARLIKIQSDPKTYAVGRGGVLRHVPDEATAVALFGNGWNRLVDDVDVAFFQNYRIGQPLVSVSQ